jgi:hypothetical protein
MSTNQTLIFAILFATLVLFAWGKWRYDLIALAAVLIIS